MRGRVACFGAFGSGGAADESAGAARAANEAAVGVSAKVALAASVGSERAFVDIGDGLRLRLGNDERERECERKGKRDITRWRKRGANADDDAAKSHRFAVS